ncbi:MAG: hypothetical protein R3Y64_09620 [Peptostreptococcaceae bacterium]
MKKNIKLILIGCITFMVGMMVSQVGAFSNDAYITSIGMVRGAVLFLSSIVSIVGYLIIERLK